MWIFFTDILKCVADGMQIGFDFFHGWLRRSSVCDTDDGIGIGIGTGTALLLAHAR